MTILPPPPVPARPDLNSKETDAGRMDTAPPQESVDYHTNATASLLREPDPVANATTTWGRFNTTSHAARPPEVNDRPTGASPLIAEVAAGDIGALEPQEDAPPPVPFCQPLPAAPERLRRRTKKTYMEHF